MCNFLHSDHKKIPKEGKGFKILHVDNKILFGGHRKDYKSDSNGWIVWKSNTFYNEEEVGFCIFLTKEAAKKCLHILRTSYSTIRYKNCFILPIEYKQGLGKHMEYQLTEGKHEIAIVKQFRIIKEEVGNEKTG